MGLYEELKRRNVIRVGIAYAVTAWLVLQIVDLVLDNIGSPPWVIQTVMLLLAAGFPLALIFAWAFEITPEGIKREREVEREASITHVTGRKLDFTIIALLLVVAGYFIWESRFEDGGPATDGSEAVPSIAVLPFVNLSSDPEQEFFSDGISEELLNVLAQYPDMRVAARTSSFQFKGDNRNIRDIAEQLKVNHVLEGSVRKAGSRLRITAQLIEAEHGYHLWSDTYDRELKDIFVIQDEISAAIGDALRAQLNLGSQQAPAAAPRVAEAANPAAYEAYLHGRYLANQRGREPLTAAAQELQKSIALDPNYAPPRAQLAIVYLLLHNSSYGDLSTAEVNAKARPHIAKARELNPQLAEGWGAECLLASTNGDNSGALGFCQRALELNPVYIDAMNWWHSSALATGQYQLSYELLERMQAADPLSIIGRINYGMALSDSDPAAAHALADQLLEANARGGRVVHMITALKTGDLATALNWALLGFAESPTDNGFLLRIALVMSYVNLAEEARELPGIGGVFAIGTSARDDFARALALLKETYSSDMNNSYILSWIGYTAYFAGEYDESLAMYRRVRELMNTGMYNNDKLLLAWLLRRAGDTLQAETLLTEVEQDLDNMNATPMAQGQDYRETQLFTLIMRDRPEEALALMEASEPHTLPARWALLSPAIAELQGNPRFDAQLERRLAWEEQQKLAVLELICHNNPVPDSWQPLPETCQGFNTAAR